VCVRGILFKVFHFWRYDTRETGLSYRRTFDNSRPSICSRCVATGCTVRYALIGESVGIYAWPRALCVFHACRCEAISWLAQLYRKKDRKRRRVCVLHLFDTMPIYLRDLWRSRNTPIRIDQLPLTTKT